MATGLLLVLLVGVSVLQQSTDQGAARPTSTIEFTQHRWYANKSHRYEMIDSLLNYKLKSVTTAEELFRLLGKPDVSWNEAGASNVMYALGSQRDYPLKRSRSHGSTNWGDVDIWYLSIQFTNGVVVKFKVTST